MREQLSSTIARAFGKETVMKGKHPIFLDSILSRSIKILK